MKKLILKIVLFALLATSVFAQEVEKICVLDEIKYEKYPIGGMGHFPTGIYIDEVNNLLIVEDPLPETIVTINLETKTISKEEKTSFSEHAPLLLKIGNDYWGNAEQTFTIYTAEIPLGYTNYKVRNGNRWFGDDGSIDKPNAYIFNYDGDKAIYE